MPSFYVQQWSGLTVDGFTMKNYTASDFPLLPALYIENKELNAISFNK